MDSDAPKADTSLVEELGALPPGAIVTEKWIAERFGRVTKSVERAVLRGELPAPSELFGEKRWTAGSIVRHIDSRIEKATQALTLERVEAMQRGKAV